MQTGYFNFSEKTSFFSTVSTVFCIFKKTWFFINDITSVFWGCLTTESSLKKNLKKLNRKTILRQLPQNQTLFWLRLHSRKVNAVNGESVVFQYRSKEPQAFTAQFPPEQRTNRERKFSLNRCVLNKLEANSLFIKVGGLLCPFVL